MFRCANAGRSAHRASNNESHDEDSLRAAIEASLSLAHSNQKIHICCRCLEAALSRHQSFRSKHDRRQLTPEDRAPSGAAACDLAIKRGQTAAGIFSSAQAQSAMGNSRALFAAYRDTHAVFSITMQEGSAAAGQRKCGERRGASIRSNWRNARARKAHRAIEPQELAPGRYTVILEPAAVLDLVGISLLRFRGHSGARQTVVLQRSAWASSFGQEHRIEDDVYHPLQLVLV